MRLILPTIMLLALAAYQPCFAKAAHPRHGVGASATNKGAKGLAVTQPHVPSALQMPGAVPPTLHGAPPAGPPVVSSNPAHATAPVANAATLSNRGSVSGAGVIRPGAAPSTIGGATRPNYGINGTAVQNKH